MRKKRRTVKAGGMAVSGVRKHAAPQELPRRFRFPVPAGHPAVHCLFIVLAGLLVYAGTFHVPFVFDDFSSIVGNPVIRNLDNFFSNGIGYRYNPRRFIGYLSFAVNFRFGGLDVAGYHLVNIVIHLANALLVYLIVRMTMRTPRLAGSRLIPRGGHIALASGLLFAVHPVETQAVTYIVQRFASLATMFYLGAIALYAAGRLAHTRADRFRGAGSTALLCSAVLAGIVAQGTKEIAVTLPFAVFLYEELFFPPSSRKRGVFFCSIVMAAVSAVILMAYGTGTSIDKLLSDVGGEMGAASVSPGRYLLTQFRVIVTYVRLVFLPLQQNIDYAYPVYHSLYQPQVLASLVVILMLLGTGVALFVRANRGGDPGLRLLSFGIFWFFLTLSVESSVIPIADVIFEHRLYLPSAGAFMAISAGIAFLGGRAPRTVVAVGCLLLFVLAGATLQRNAVWSNAEALWRDAIAKSPDKARPYNELGNVYVDAGRYAEAIALFKTALVRNPSYIQAHNNLGNAYDKIGDFDAAIAAYQVVLRLSPGQPAALNNLGGVYFRKGWVERAIAEYEAALRIKPDYADARNNLGTGYRSQGRYAEAVDQFRQALRLMPDSAVIHNNLGIAYALSGRGDAAAESFRAAVRLQPDNEDYRRNLAIALKQKEALDRGRATEGR